LRERSSLRSEKQRSSQIRNVAPDHWEFPLRACILSDLLGQPVAPSPKVFIQIRNLAVACCAIFRPLTRALVVGLSAAPKIDKLEAGYHSSAERAPALLTAWVVRLVVVVRAEGHDPCPHSRHRAIRRSGVPLLTAE
jgi:hypothetical protein